MVCEIISSKSFEEVEESLNPCFRGIWSVSNKIDEAMTKKDSLNPCFRGIWSVSIISDAG